MRLSHALSIFLLTGTSLVSLKTMAAPSLYDPTLFPGGSSISLLSYGYALSGDGLVAVGSIEDPYYESFIWTQSGGLVKLGYAPGDIGSQAAGVNLDGTVVVGVTIDGTFNSRASIWTSGTGMVSLGILAGGLNSRAFDVSDDGTIVVGESENGSTIEAFRWTSGTGMVGLGFLGGDNYSTARSISGDGTIIVGNSQGAGITRAFRWTSGTGMVDIGNLGGSYTDAWGISRDGSIIVGGGYDGSSVTRAFYWTSGAGIVDISIPTHTYSIARATNLDGSTIVGYTTDGVLDGAFRWTSATGTEYLSDILTNAGVDMSNWYLSDAWAVSDDGSTIIGRAYYLGVEKAFLFSTAFGAPGVTTPGELLISLLPTVAPSQQSYTLMSDGVGQSLLVARNALSTYFPDLPLSSSHLSGSVIDTSIPQDIAPAAGAEEEIFNPYGQKRMAFYTTGNLGIGQNNNSDNSSLNGSAGLLVELDSKTVIGAGLILGRNHEETQLDGKSNVNATGISFNGTYESLSGLRLYGTTAIALLDVKTQRNYMNASSVDSSNGKTNGIGYGMSLRAGYEINKESDISIMPYTELQLSHSQLDAYTETGGAFPAQISKQTGTNFISLLGTEISKEVTPDLTLRARGAWGHRYTDDSQVTATSASLTQTITGDAGDKNWLELGMTMNYKINDKTTISADVQGRSSRTSDPMIKAGFGLIWNWN